MSGKSGLSENFLKEVSNQYCLEGLVRKKKMPRGIMQSNFHIKTYEGDYLLRIYNDKKSLKSITFEINLLIKLKNNSFPCPGPIKNRQKKYITNIDGDYVVLFDYLEGHHKKRNQIPKESLKDMTKKLAELHKITKNYKPKYSQYRENLGKKQILKDLYSQYNNPRKRSQEMIHYVEDKLKKIKTPYSLPKGTIHGDYNSENVLFNGKKVSAIIDFDGSCYTFLGLDVASEILFLAWPDEGEFNRKKAQEILKTYSKYRKISEKEKRYLFDFLAIITIMHLIWFGEEPGKDMYSRRLEWLLNLGREEFYSIITNQNS